MWGHSWKSKPLFSSIFFPSQLAFFFRKTKVRVKIQVSLKLKTKFHYIFWSIQSQFHSTKSCVDKVNFQVFSGWFRALIGFRGGGSKICSQCGGHVTTRCWWCGAAADALGLTGDDEAALQLPCTSHESVSYIFLGENRVVTWKYSMSTFESNLGAHSSDPKTLHATAPAATP